MLIDSTSDLSQLVDVLRSEQLFGMDTEFIRERTFYPRLCLVQVSLPDGATFRGENAVLIDPLEVQDLSKFVELLGDESIEKVVHAGQQDMEIFFARDAGAPKNIFDNQIAAALVGCGESLGYARLVEKVLGRTVGKSATFTDWARRPLSREQRDYALEDVRHLLPVREKLLDRVESLGREDWLEEELLVYESPTLYRREPGSEYLKVKGAGRLSRRELAILRQLARWREADAETRDRPRNRILADNILVELARRSPRSERELADFRGVPAPLARRSGSAILEAVERGRSCPDEELPAAFEKGGRKEELASAVDLLDVLLRIRAEENEIAPSYLASRKELHRMAERFFSGEEKDSARVLSGWRGRLVGEDLVALLRGESVLGVDPRDGKVVARVPQGR